MPIEPTKNIWMNGEMIPWEDAQIHVLTHTLHYGTGIFEGIRAYETSEGPAIFRLREHMDRMMNSAKILLEKLSSIEGNKQLNVFLTRQGGHNGFHGNDGCWGDVFVKRWLVKICD